MAVRGRPPGRTPRTTQDWCRVVGTGWQDWEAWRRAASVLTVAARRGAVHEPPLRGARARADDAIAVALLDEEALPTGGVGGFGGGVGDDGVEASRGAIGLGAQQAAEALGF